MATSILTTKKAQAEACASLKNLRPH